MALDFGSKISSTVRNTLPLLLIVFLFLDIRVPSSLLNGTLFVISLILAVFIGSQFDLFFNVFAFWTVNVWGLRVLKAATITFFSGILLPISFYPDWLQLLNQFLPFQSMVYVPVSIYTGTLTGTNIWIALALQVFWMIALFVVVSGLLSFEK
jgi:ABC-2 type transport system permease protein